MCHKYFNDTVRFLVEHYPNVGFTKCKVKRVVNLFQDTGSVRELHSPAEKAEHHYYLKIYRRGMWLFFFNQSLETF
jgi:hypothetical protein